MRRSIWPSRLSTAFLLIMLNKHALSVYGSHLIESPFVNIFSKMILCLEILTALSVPVTTACELRHYFAPLCFLIQKMLGTNNGNIKR